MSFSILVKAISVNTEISKFVLYLIASCFVGCISAATSNAQSTYISDLVRGKNVAVYLEDLNYGYQASKFAYNPESRSVDIQDDPVKENERMQNAAQKHAIKSLRTLSKSSLGEPKLLPTNARPISNAQNDYSFENINQVNLTEPSVMSPVNVARPNSKQGTKNAYPPYPAKTTQNTRFNGSIRLVSRYQPPQSPQTLTTDDVVQPSGGLSIPDYPTPHYVASPAQIPLTKVALLTDNHQSDNLVYPTIEHPQHVGESTKPEIATNQGNLPQPPNPPHFSKNPYLPYRSQYDAETINTPDHPTSHAAKQMENQPTGKHVVSDEVKPEPITDKSIEEIVNKAVANAAWKKGGFTFTPYGYINLSATWESERTINGDYCVYAQSPELTPSANRSAFYVDPRSSRIGLRIDGPGTKYWTNSKTRAVFECDFQGSYQVRNRSGFLLRKAYVEIGDDESKFLFGQDWEVFSPLYPMTFNYPAGSGVGNLGYRRAMIRADHAFKFGCDSSLLFQFAICDNTIRDYTGGGTDVPRVTASGWPIIQGRIAYAFGEKRFRHEQAITLGISGQIGEQRVDYVNPTLIGQKLTTWAVCVDLDVPITKKMRIQAELYDGDNVSNLEGGILQGIDMVRRDTIRCKGGWAAVQYQWTKKMKTNVGYAIEDPNDKDLLGTASYSGNMYSSRTYNQSIFGNVMYNWTEAFMTGVELSFWKTNWQQYNSNTTTITNLEPGEPTRIEFVARYTF